MRSDLSKSICQHLLLIVISLSLILLPLGSGMFFGSEGDWYSQHVGIAESLRQTMLETGNLIPQYINLGGTCSIYDFSYYGVLRPDILISCLIPKVEMKYIIAAYAILGMIATVNLCYWWLRKVPLTYVRRKVKKQQISRWFAFAGAILLAASTCFYHAHHQIMFVNYMPFLILALIGVNRLLEKGKSGLLAVSLFLVYLHSFYYAIASLAVIIIYYLHQMMIQQAAGKTSRNDWVKTTVRVILTIGISIGMAAILLIPTGLNILSTGKDAGSFVNEPMKVIDLSLEGLLYSPYGCGMTILTLYCVLLSLNRKRKRFLAASVLLAVLVPAAALVLNGFLYPRAKILIPFLPLFTLICADTLEDLYRRKQKYLLLPMLLCGIPLAFSDCPAPVWTDGVILLAWIVVQRIVRIRDKVKNAAFALVFISPICISLCVNRTGESYLSADDARQSHFTNSEIAAFAANDNYRFEVLANNFVNCNLLADSSIHRTAMYSSITNKAYADFYYDIMRNPISINNRVALLPSQNSFFNYAMGIRYLLTDQENLPDGYEPVLKKGNYLLAENKDVLPICYGTYHLLGEQDYQKLDFPETMEALCSRAIVSAETTEKFESHLEEINAADFFADDGVQKLLNLSEAKENCILPLAMELHKKILIISFQVENLSGRPVTISINGIKNKLSSETAPYPNHNYVFTYVIPAEESLKELELVFSKGGYEISSLKIYTMDDRYLNHADITEAVPHNNFSNSGTTVFEGEITMAKDGYFITSYPYREGYQIDVDGSSIKIEKVNAAFVGFPITKGVHQIRIIYESPGFRVGQTISIISLGLLFLLLIKEIREIKERKHSNA